MKKDLSKKILKQIKKEKVKMRPRAYFVAGSVLLGVGFAGAFIFSVLFVNRAFFRLRVFGPFGNLAFGQAGIRPFLNTFPFLSFLLATGGILGGIYLLRKYEFSYKRSAISLLIGAATLVLTLGFVLDEVGVGEKLARSKHLGLLYSTNTMMDEFIVGEITAVEENKLTLLTPQGDEVDIIFNKDTLLPFGSDFAVGERVRVLGDWEEDVFKAEGIGKGGGLRWKMLSSPMPKPNVRGMQNPPLRMK